MRRQRREEKRRKLRRPRRLAPAALYQGLQKSEGVVYPLPRRGRKRERGESVHWGVFLFFPRGAEHGKGGTLGFLKNEGKKGEGGEGNEIGKGIAISIHHCWFKLFARAKGGKSYLHKSSRPVTSWTLD